MSSMCVWQLVCSHCGLTCFIVADLLLLCRRLQMFSSEDAEQWWNANRERIYAAFNISQQHPAPSWQQHPGQQGQQSPELLSQQQQLLSPQLTSNGSGVSRMLLSLNNPHPLGGPSVGSAAAAVGLRELLVKR